MTSVDGGCPGVKNVKAGVIGATSMQYPLLMASKGVEAIVDFKKTGEKPKPSPGLDFFNTGVTLVTDKPVAGHRVDHLGRSSEEVLGLIQTSRNNLLVRESWPIALRSEDRLTLQRRLLEGDLSGSASARASCGMGTAMSAADERLAPDHGAMTSASRVSRSSSHSPCGACSVRCTATRPSCLSWCWRSGSSPSARSSAAAFLAPFNLSLILQQVTIVGIIGIAQTLVMLTAGVDLSVGAIMILVTVVTGHLAVTSGVPTPLRRPDRLGIGMGCGAINGVLVAVFRLPPFIVTLGTWSVYGAIFLWYSASQTIRSQEVAAAAPFLQLTGTAWTPRRRPLHARHAGGAGHRRSVWYALNRTAFGRHVYATGDDAEAARLAGIDTRGTVLAVYTLAGLICSLGAWVLIGRIGAIRPTSGGTANLDSITATVIGGTSFFGGRGSIVGTLVGALIVGVFRNGLALAGLDALWQEFAVGLLIIVAVALDQWIRRVSA